ncbi:metal-sensing transcriptional repressor [Candidatus Dojkabacteria bacterium]|nr:metal-sensing transcriptional repressor [Candidatus Dojkabacteria bacterium]
MKDSCDSNKTVLTTLKKARSHIDKIIEMVEEDKYCIEIIQQLNAIDGYIDSARKSKLISHLETCFADGMTTKSPAKKQELIDELIRVLKITK